MNVGKKKTAEYIASVLAEVIDELGPKNVLQVVTDSAEACKKAGKILETQFKGLTWVPCAAHCLDLYLTVCFKKTCGLTGQYDRFNLLQDVGKKIERMADLIAMCRRVIFFIKNHQAALAMLKQFSNKTLLCPGATR
jgi:hypothetical protein